MLFESKRRNYLIILLCFFLYFSTYFLKYSYNANIINIEQRFSVSHSETGLVSSLFFISYGAGQFINGLFVRKYNLKYAVTISILLSSAINIALLLTPTNMFYIVKYYWFVNGACLSVLFPCVIRFLTENIFDKYKETGSFMFGTVTAIGTVAAYACSALFTKINKYSIIFIVGASLGIFFAISWFFLFNKLLAPVGLNAIKEKEKIETTKIRSGFVIYSLLCCLLCIVACFGRDGIQSWAPSILNETFNIPESSSLLITILLPIGQFAGVILSTFTKKFIKSHILLCILYFAFAGVCLGIGWIFNFNNKIVLIFVMVLTIVASSAILHIIVDILPVAWSKERNSGLFAGLFNGCCYIGAAVSSYGLSVIADNKGWNGVFKVISIVYFVIIVIALLYFFVRKILRKIGYDIK